MSSQGDAPRRGDLLPKGLEATLQRRTRDLPGGDRIETAILDRPSAVRLATMMSGGAPGASGAAARLESLAGLHSELAARTSEPRRLLTSAATRVTGYPESVIDSSLRDLFASLDAPGLQPWAAVTEPLVPAGGGLVRRMPPSLALVISSGNIPGAALPSITGCLVMGSAVIARPAEGEPVLLTLYGELLAQRLPGLARALAVAQWEPGDASVADPLLTAADAVILYGGEAAVESVRSSLGPETRFLGYGPRISFGVVAREALSRRELPRTAAAVALDTALFDQQGCMSPHAFYVEAGGEATADELAAEVAAELDRLTVRIPRRPLSPAEAADIHRWRSEMEMRSLAGEPVRLLAGEDLAWSVALAPAARLAAGPGNRSLLLQPVESLDQVPGLIRPSRRRLLAAIVAAPSSRRESLANLLAASGVKRLVGAGASQRSEPWAWHDGFDQPALLTRTVIDLL